MDRLLGLVKLGMTQSARNAEPPPPTNPPRNGAAPAAAAAVMYSSWHPSTQTTTSGRSIQRYVRPLTVRGADAFMAMDPFRPRDACEPGFRRHAAAGAGRRGRHRARRWRQPR